MRTLLPVAILLSTSLPAQTTFAPIGAKWTYKQGSCCGPDTNLMVIEVTSDTLIQGRTCSKLQVNEGWFGCHDFVQFFSGSNDSLFYFDPDLEQYHLLFRWNATIGESWSTPVDQSGYLDTLDWSVTDTSHTIVDGLWLRTLDVNVESRHWMLFSYGGVITERLGGSGAPFTWILGFCDGETFQGLRCYEDPDITWLNPQILQCELTTGFADQSAGSQIILSPNPVLQGEMLKVTLSGRSAHNARIEVIGATGSRIASVPVRSPITDVIMSGPGLFLIMIDDGSGHIATKKVVVY